ncbi:hypothetical protein B0F90DRAFT_1679430 [Multifurca ochricompacta]|uniref:Uncharacterized protein n=1 Tax=Multifurca ochricompacta TaxID=376703 RepID=A0AAD4MD76_9AGAM|nr:hypothetical protein B0F90DRAFT_1679430 [Multifurca ochricompacta]
MRMNDTAETRRGTYFRTQYRAVESEVVGLGVKCEKRNIDDVVDELYRSIYEHLIGIFTYRGLPTHCTAVCDEASRQATCTQREIKVVSG